MGLLGTLMGPLGAHMGPWGPLIGTGIGPLNFCQNVEWKNGMTLYRRTKTDNFRFGPHIGLLGGPYGALGTQYWHRPIVFLAKF